MGIFMKLFLKKISNLHPDSFAYVIWDTVFLLAMITFY